MKKKLDNTSVFSYHISDFYDKNSKIINAIFFMFIILIIGHLFNLKASGKPIDSQNETINITNKATPKEETKIVVYISGEVKNPDVYTVSENLRLKDLIELAGGFTENAYVENLNLAKKLFDEDHITVLNKNDITENTIATIENLESKVNINTAPVDELTKLKGIGESTAKAIISYREENGKFENIEEIVNVSGIGEKTLEKFKDEITVR